MANPAFHPEKFQEMILNASILGYRDPGFDIVKLSFALYYADLAAALETGQSISRAEYRKTPAGPTAREFPEQLKTMVEEKTLILHETRWLGRKIQKPCAQRRAKWEHNDQFTCRERQLAEDAARAVAALTPEQLQSQARRDKNWQETRDFEILPLTEP